MKKCTERKASKQLVLNEQNLPTTIRTLKTNCSKLKEQYGITKFAVAVI